MKNKLLAALEQRYGGALGSKNEIYEKVVTAYGNLITSEEQIPDIVAGVEPLLKDFQSVNDKLRAFEKKKEQTPPPSDNGNQPNPNPEPPKPADEKPDFKAMFAEALAEVVNPLKEEIATFKAEQSAKTALSTAEATFKGNDYVKKYADEADAAWEMTNEIRKYNPNWTAEEIVNDAMSRFNKAVAKKGVDTSKPFESDGGGGETDADFSSFERAAQKLGWTEPDK
ncbi:MAG: hypothetical protein K2M94_06065 [Paramuribaculum sp.]|nr:hypothetical protein [Paramuribaculum sp.]